MNNNKELDNNKKTEINKDKAFIRLYKLQLLLKKESALRELCKIRLLIKLFIKSYRY